MRSLEACVSLFGPGRTKQSDGYDVPVAALEELEFLQGSKSKIDMSTIYPVDPQQLPKEMAQSRGDAKARPLSELSDLTQAAALSGGKTHLALLRRAPVLLIGLGYASATANFLSRSRGPRHSRD